MTRRALDSQGPDEADAEDSMLRELTSLVHTKREDFRQGEGMSPAGREDSEFIVRLTAAAMLGDGIFGPFLDAMTGHADDPDVRRRFRAWFARLLLEHLSRD